MRSDKRKTHKRHTLAPRLSGNCGHNRHATCFNLGCTCTCHLKHSKWLREKSVK